MSRLGVLAVFVTSIIGPGCSRDTERRGGLRVIGSAHKDFGRVKGGEKKLTHVFEVQNASNRRLSIANVRQTCTCLDLTVATRDLEPGGITEVTMRLDDTALVGEKAALAILEVDDSAVDPLYLKLTATIERDCVVLVQPAQWTLPAAVESEPTVEKVFRVRQVIPEGIEKIAETHVRSLDRQLTVGRVSEWTSVGRVINGYAREAEVALTYHRDGESTLGSKAFELEFELRFRTPVRERSEMKTSARIVVKRL